jgi:hypothetical protein
VILWYLVSRLFALITGPFIRGNSLVPYTDRLRALIASDVDDLRHYGSYYTSTEYGALALRTSESLRTALRLKGIRDGTLQAWADARDAFGAETITSNVGNDTAWLEKLRRLGDVAGRMALAI